MGLDTGDSVDVRVFTFVDLGIVKAFARTELTWLHGSDVNRKDYSICVTTAVAVCGALSLTLVRRGSGTLKRRLRSRRFTGVSGGWLLRRLGWFIRVTDVFSRVRAGVHCHLWVGGHIGSDDGRVVFESRQSDDFRVMMAE